jgi:uncharacterized protein YciI
MRFDSHTVTMLLLRPDAPAMTDEELSELQDRHLDHGARLQEQGIILARGPLTDQDDERVRGISVWSVDQDTARRLANQDPSVLAGRLEVQVMTWLVPAGNLAFGRVWPPHSMAEVRGDEPPAA